MPTPALVILLVNDPTASAAFYTGLLGTPPIEASATFAMIPLADGLALGLWSRHTVTPAPGAAAGGTELAFTVTDVDATHADWVARGIAIAAAPADLDFGRSFLALDPDGHRLRVFAPGE